MRATERAPPSTAQCPTGGEKRAHVVLSHQRCQVTLFAVTVHDVDRVAPLDPAGHVGHDIRVLQLGHLLFEGGGGGGVGIGRGGGRGLPTTAVETSRSCKQEPETHHVPLLERAVALPVGLLRQADALEHVGLARLLVDHQEGGSKGAPPDLLPHLKVGREVHAAGHGGLLLGLCVGCWECGEGGWKGGHIQAARSLAKQ